MKRLLGWLSENLGVCLGFSFGTFFVLGIVYHIAQALFSEDWSVLTNVAISIWIVFVIAVTLAIELNLFGWYPDKTTTRDLRLVAFTNSLPLGVFLAGKMLFEYVGRDCPISNILDAILLIFFFVVMFIFPFVLAWLASEWLYKNSRACAVVAMIASLLSAAAMTWMMWEKYGIPNELGMILTLSLETLLYIVMVVLIFILPIVKPTKPKHDNINIDEQQWGHNF